jgi:hypothetical protein
VGTLGIALIASIVTVGLLALAGIIESRDEKAPRQQQEKADKKQQK